MPDSFPLRGKIAVVTGGSRGLGADMALELARHGASVLITYTSDSSTPKVQDLISRINSLGHDEAGDESSRPSVHSVKSDLSEPSCAAAILQALDDWRGPNARVDILVNNAGVEVQRPVDEITAEDFHRVYDVNVLAPILLMAGLRSRLGQAARIINIGSVGARVGFPGLSLYCSSKAALEGLTRCWAVELGGDGTTVNQVNPGPVESDMLDNIPKEIVDLQKRTTPVQNRMGTPGEVAAVVCWLASPGSSWISGQVLSASGGYAMY